MSSRSFQKWNQKLGQPYRLTLQQRNDGWYNPGCLMNIHGDWVCRTSNLQLVLWHYISSRRHNKSLPLSKAAVRSRIYFLPALKGRIAWHLPRKKGKKNFTGFQIHWCSKGTAHLSTSLHRVDNYISSAVALLICVCAVMCFGTFLAVPMHNLDLYRDWPLLGKLESSQSSSTSL